MSFGIGQGVDGSGDERRFDYAPAVYGSLLVTTLVTIQWHGEPNPELIAFSLVIGVVAFWLTDAWSEIVAHRVYGPIERGTAFRILRSQATMLTSVVVPGIILSLPWLLGVPIDLAIGAALAVSLIQLFLWGLAVGLAARGSPLLALGVALVDLGIGVVVVILKVLAIH